MQSVISRIHFLPCCESRESVVVTLMLRTVDPFYEAIVAQLCRQGFVLVVDAIGFDMKVMYLGQF
jgi:hypothetical protein